MLTQTTYSIWYTFGQNVFRGLDARAGYGHISMQTFSKKKHFFELIVSQNGYFPLKILNLFNVRSIYFLCTKYMLENKIKFLNGKRVLLLV